MDRGDLALFAHMIRRPEGLDLAQASLLIAAPEYAGIDIAHYLAVLERVAAEVRRRSEDLRPEVPMTLVLRLLYGELGLHGNESDYYDPRNSFLNEVLDRRTGIPITLAVVVIEVARRAGIEAQGVPFPGHFLVRVPGPRLLDPFTGKFLRRADLRALYARTSGVDRDPEPRLLEPATNHQILQRMLHNLRGIYATRGDRERLRGVLLRLQILAPSPEVDRDLALLDEAGSIFAVAPSPRGAPN